MIAEPDDRLLLLDANNIIVRLWRAWSRHGRPPLLESWGHAINRWRRAVKPTHALAVFDGEGENWRRRLWPAYKANREGQARPSAAEWASCKAVCEAHGLLWSQVHGEEADDVIASYAVAAARAGLGVAIVSSDKDMMQLLRNDPVRVRQIDPGSGKVAGPAEVFATWGVWPHAIPDLLALVGDKSDNYPGIKGIGLLRAAPLIAEHGDLEQLIDRANLLPGKLAATMRDGAEQARLFRRLAQLREDLPVAEDIERTRLVQDRRRWPHR